MNTGKRDELDQQMIMSVLIIPAFKALVGFRINVFGS